MDDNKRKWWILFNVSLGIFMSTLDGGIVNLALPTIMESFKIQMVTVQWVITAYLLVISSFLPIFGRISDIFGRKKLYAFGYIIFGAGSLLCALSKTIEFLILSRIIQALGASILMSNGQGIVTAAFPANERGRALGLTGSVVAIGNLAGPGVGGLLSQAFGWSSVFYINIPIGILGYFVSMAVLSEDKNPEKERFDLLGSLLFISGTSFLFFSLSGFESPLYSRSLLYAMLFGGIVLLASFIYTELKVRHPLVDLGLFRNYVFTLGVLSAFIIFLAMNSITILMPFYLQEILKLTPTAAGLTLMVFPVTMAIIAPISGHLSDKIGYGILTTIGLLLFTVGLLLMSTLSLNSPVIWVALRFVFFGMGSAMFQSPNNSAIMGSVPKNKLGIAGGLNALVRNLGMISGITFSVSLLSHRLSLLGTAPGEPGYTSGYVKSMDYVYLASAAICFLAVIISFIRSKKKE